MKLDEKLVGISTVGISGHVRPDGDCVGSTLAVYNYIRTYYPEVSVELYLESIPSVFNFLQNADKICNTSEEDKEFDLFIALDSADLSRMGDNEKYFHLAKNTFCPDC